ncbi:MAG: aminotransferase class I/II-fold pyridoxal phosphate-dependent enzyme [Bacteroidetes bacterium]|nr:aminotransferase class I/II-fold pyridoxal phosphate-dependent enzyme [Bacteroidota bacterium]MCH8247360.1 aminotransferase class I/II-fold pyridoxal phosphate-dependent enzyme [Bacteroidota bacterium]
MIDLRSDTVTKPSPGMLQAMVNAEVGDDVFGEDPTVKELQSEISALLGKEAGLFVPSGVMSNQLALRVHTNPGDEVILESGSHIANHESGAAGALAGVQLLSIKGSRGIIDPTEIENSIRTGYYWEPNPRLVCIENTHNQAGGVIYPLDTILETNEIVRERDLAFHLDGARLWNASIATGVSEAQYAAPFDSISVCLSKGLGAPIGSVLVGSSDFIAQAHRFRKMYGGGMRQVGILAAAGLFALRNQKDDLANDHARAKILAEGLSAIAAFSVDPTRVETNIVMFDVQDDSISALEKMKAAGVLMVPFGPKTIRATTHRDVDDASIDEVLRILNRIF